MTIIIIVLGIIMFLWVVCGAVFFTQFFANCCGKDSSSITSKAMLIVIAVSGPFIWFLAALYIIFYLLPVNLADIFSDKWLSKKR